MKDQAFFSSKDKSKKIICRLLQILYGALRVQIILDSLHPVSREFMKFFFISIYFKAVMI